MAIRCSPSPSFVKFLNSIKEDQLKTKDLSSIFDHFENENHKMIDLTKGKLDHLKPCSFGMVVNQNGKNMYYKDENKNQTICYLKITLSTSMWFGYYILGYFTSILSEEIFLLSVLSKAELLKLKANNVSFVDDSFFCD
jgi:hypothetical protein